jgi:hypothetical protein
VIEDFQTGKSTWEWKQYPLMADKEARLAQLDSEIGVIQERREKLMKSMKAREAQIAMLFSDNYYIKSEWSEKTIPSNPLKPMQTLDISSGGDPNVEQAEIFMSSIWASLTAYPKQFSVRLFQYSMRFVNNFYWMRSLGIRLSMINHRH